MRSASQAASWSGSSMWTGTRLGTCGRSMQPTRACGYRRGTPVTAASACSPPWAGSSAISTASRSSSWWPTPRPAHDMLFPPCDRWLYQSRGLAGHPNCRDNFLAAVASAGISLPVVPAPVNLFQNSGPQPDGSLLVGTASSRPGDAISFRALRDLVFVLTSCSVDYPPLNNGRCTPLRIEITPKNQDT